MADFSDFELSYRQRAGARPAPNPDRGGSKRVLVMGDFSGAARDAPPSSASDGWRPRRVEFDNFEHVLADVAPVVRWSDSQAALTQVPIRTLDDFHPDHLIRTVEAFKPLRNAKALVQQDRGSIEAVADLLRDAGLLLGVPDEKTTDSQQSLEGVTNESTEPSDDSEAALLDRLLGERPMQQKSETPQVDISGLLKKAVEGRTVPSAGNREQQILMSIDLAITQTMRFLLHDPVFQSLEAVWRSLWRLVTGSGAGETIQVYLLDLSKTQLVSALSGCDDWRASDLYRVVVERSSDPWAMMIGDYRFGGQATDIASLAMLGGIAAEAGCPFVAGAHSDLLGCRSLVGSPSPSDWDAPESEALQGWRQLRDSGLAPWIGLVAPQVLLRLPYGCRTDRIESLEFEEFGGQDEHGSYLWGNPSFVCAQLAMQAWSQGQACGTYLDVEDLPAYAFSTADGETALKACAEVYLSQRSAEEMLRRGIMPLLSFQDRNMARLLRFQSVSQPLAALAGM